MLARRDGRPRRPRSEDCCSWAPTSGVRRQTSSLTRRGKAQAIAELRAARGERQI
jgi:hypothetical protein